jgi:hypothetical protein
MEASLPHVMLAVSAADAASGRELVERALAGRSISYGVQERDGLVQLAAIICERDYLHVRKALLELDGLSVDSEGREESIRGEDKPAAAEGEACEGGRIMKVVITVAAA